jgi:CheY-like chemotaxis protein
VLIAVTGMASEEEVQKAIAAGFHIHLTKPVDPKVLFEMVDWFRQMRAK